MHRLLVLIFLATVNLFPIAALADTAVSCPMTIQCTSNNLSSCIFNSRWQATNTTSGVIAGTYLFAGGTYINGQAQCWYVNKANLNYNFESSNTGSWLYVQVGVHWKFVPAKQGFVCGTLTNPTLSLECLFWQKA